MYSCIYPREARFKRTEMVAAPTLFYIHAQLPADVGYTNATTTTFAAPMSSVIHTLVSKTTAQYSSWYLPNPIVHTEYVGYTWCAARTGWDLGS